MLLQMVSRYVYDRDVSTPPVQFALTEVADEVRHMIMFARVVDAIGSQIYPTPTRIKQTGRLLKSAAPVSALWALVLLTEEMFDRTQREMAADETVQPLVRAMARIHVIEEARHISFARTEIEARIPELSRVELSAFRALLAMSVQTFAGEFFNPQVYRRVGLDHRQAMREARANPHVRETFRWAASRITDYYSSIGLIGGASAHIWTHLGFR